MMNKGLEDTPLQLFAYDLIEQAELRNKLIDRVDVLNKVKELFLLPVKQMMTTNMVADFYDVPLFSINTVYNRNKDEIDNDGVQFMRSRAFRDFFLVQNEQEENKVFAYNKVGLTTFSFNGKKIDVPNGGTKLFTPRAVLRIGMLLRDSEVAKEVRTQLSQYKDIQQSETRRSSTSSVRDSLDSIISLCYLYWAILHLSDVLIELKSHLIEVFFELTKFVRLFAVQNVLCVLWLWMQELNFAGKIQLQNELGMVK